MDATSRTFLTEKRHASAVFATCLATALIVIGALTRVLGGQFAATPHMPDTALVDGFPGADAAIIRGNPAVRSLAEARRTVPALDDGSSALIPTVALERSSAAADCLQGPLDLELGHPRSAHRPRGPPSLTDPVDQPAHCARLPILLSCTCGANRPDGLHQT